MLCKYNISRKKLSKIIPFGWFKRSIPTNIYNKYMKRLNRYILEHDDLSDKEIHNKRAGKHVLYNPLSAHYNMRIKRTFHS